MHIIKLTAPVYDENTYIAVIKKEAIVIDPGCPYEIISRETAKLNLKIKLTIMIQVIRLINQILITIQDCHIMN